MAKRPLLPTSVFIFDQSDPEDFDLNDVSDRIADVLGGRPVELATRASLHPTLSPAIEAGAVRVF